MGSRQKGIFREGALVVGCRLIGLSVHGVRGGKLLKERSRRIGIDPEQAVEGFDRFRGLALKNMEPGRKPTCFWGRVGKGKESLHESPGLVGLARR